MSYKNFYESYLDEVIDPGTHSDWFNVKCPFHDDTKPSAGISKKTGVLHCFTCDQDWSPAKFLADYIGMPLSDAHQLVDLFRTENSLIEKVDTFVTKRPLPNARFNRLWELSKQFMSPDRYVVQEYMAARDIRYETLTELGVGYLPASETSWERDSLVFPYIHDGKVVGIRYRDAGGNKGGEPNCYFTLWGIDRLDDETVSDVIIICEGETDCCKVHQATGGKYTVVSTPTATFKKEWDREFQGSHQVILIPQFDEPSLKMVDKARAFIHNIEVLWLNWRKRQVGKDVGDWLRYNNEEALSQLIEGLVRKRNRRVMTGAELKVEASTPRQWLIGGLLSRQQICLIGGQPKSKKTWAALNIVRSLINGEALFDIPTFVPMQEDVKVLFWEEEGALEELYERVEKTLGDIEGWEEHTHWAHQLGLKLDTDEWIIRLGKEIEERKIDILILDPFSRMYSTDEDSSSEMGQVWGRVASLINRYPHLAIVILHHFTKSGNITDGFSAFRGTSRNGAEADLGIFMETRSAKEGGGARLHIQGRSIRTPVAADGSEVFKLNFEDSTGMLKVESHQVVAGRGGALIQELVDRGGEWGLNDCADHFKVTKNTIHNWVSKAIHPKTEKPIMEITKPAPGKAATIVLLIDPDDD